MSRYDSSVVRRCEVYGCFNHLKRARMVLFSLPRCRVQIKFRFLYRLEGKDRLWLFYLPAVSRSKNARGGLPYKKGRGCSSYLLGDKNTYLIALRVFSRKRFTAGGKEGGKSNWKKRQEIMWCFGIGSSLSFFKIFRVFTISSYAHKIGSWNLLGVLFKISDEHSVLSFYGSSRSTGVKTNPSKFAVKYGKKLSNCTQ